MNTGMKGYAELVFSENGKVPSGHITGNVRVTGNEARDIGQSQKLD